MKKLILFFIALSLLALFGCNTTPVGTPPPDPKDSVHVAAEWVKTRSGFIEDAVSAITRVAVYSSDKDTFERTRTIEVMHAIAGNLNALVANGNVNPDEIKSALKINEPYFGEVMSAVSSLIQVELKNFQDNGYEDLGVAILMAVSQGIKDGTAQ